MRKTVSALFRTGIGRILVALLFAVSFWAGNASAATVRWEVLPDRERVTVQLNKEEGFAGNVTRVDAKGLLLDLGVPTTGLGQNHAPDNARLFAMSEPRGRALGFFMKTAEFGYVVTRPDRNTVIINAFADPMGARWTSNGTAAAPGGQVPPPMVPAAVPDIPAQRAGTAQPRNMAAAPSGRETTIQPAQTQLPAESASASPQAQAPAGATAQAAIEPASPAASSSPQQQAAAAAQSSPTATVAQTTGNPGVVRGRIGSEQQPAAANQTFSSADANARQSAPAVQYGGTEFRSRINSGSLSDWQSTRTGAVPAGTAPQGSPSTSAPAASVGSPTPATSGPSSTPAAPATQSADGSPAPGAAPETTKVYVDAQGNPVPPPPDPVEAMAEVRKDVATGNFKDALAKIKPLLSHPELTREQMEEVLHLNAEVLFMAHQNDLAGNFDAIVSATVSAMNYNQNSPRNAAAYLRLGYVNLKVGNLVEADAYFSRLRRQYPLDESVPLTYYYWGEYYYGRNEMQQAADQFQYIISNHSESKYARDAALGLARSYTALGYYQEAFDIIDYVERRWPRLYLQSPPVLELMGDVAFHQGNLDFALDKYMLYYNLLPNGPSADVILTRIGDVYARKRQLAAAKTAYTEAEQRFPDKDGGLVAMMRLAEVGINDTPEIQQMFSVFQGPFTLRPAEIYKKIIDEHPDSALVPLAQLKLAMWHLWSKHYEQTLAVCSDLVKRFPNHELAPRAEEVAMKAFSALAAEGATQNRSGQVIASWESSNIIRKQEENLSPESRVSLAQSMWKQGNPEGALEMVAPMFLGRKDPTFGEPALQLALSIYLDHDMWPEIEKLASQVELWELTDKTRLQFDYALALARENSGRSKDAAPVWQRLAGKSGLADKQQAYVEYFLARDAEDERRLQDAYLLGRSALNRFMVMAQADPKQADVGKINALLASLMDICETSGRLDEALDYANQYMNRLAENDSQRQGMLFRIAGIYRKQGNTPEWRKALVELSETYPDSVHGKAAASTLRSSRLAEEAAQFAPGGRL